MTTVTVEAVVHRPPADVFRFVATDHFDNHPKWDPDVISMQQTSPGPTGVGTTATVARRQGRRRVEGSVKVATYEPDRLAAWVVDFGQFHLVQRSEFTAEEGGAATRLRLTIETSAGGPMRLLLPLLRGRFRRTMTASLTSIRRHVEASSSSED